MPWNPEDAIAQFVDAAREYCAWAEEPSDASVEQCGSRLLSRVYAAALDLPDVDFDAVSASPPDDPGFSLKKRAATRFSALPFQYYWEVFHAVTTEPEEPCCGDLQDDLCDIYVDLKEGLVLFDQGSPPSAVWPWRTTFGCHWGRHALSAMKALFDYEPEDAA